MENLLSMRQRPFAAISRILCWEATLAVIYDSFVGPAYLSGLAGQLKISLSAVTFLVAIPWIGMTGQIIGAWAFEHCSSVKRYVLGLASIGRGLWVLPLMLALYWGQRSYFDHIPFPTSLWFIIAALSACVSSLLTSASGNAWMYWMKHLVPEEIQGRFFGTRQKFTTASFILLSLFSATLIGWVYKGYHIGPAILCTLALAAGGISILMYTGIPDVSHPVVTLGNKRSFSKLIMIPWQNQEFRRFLLFGAAFNGSYNLSTVYVPYFLTKDMGISMSSILIWNAVMNIGCFLASSYWGKLADKGQSSYKMLWYTGLAMVLAPLVYLIKDPYPLKILAPVEYFTTGFIWCGFILAQTKVLMRLSPSSQGPIYFSVFAAACGLMGALFTFLGGLLVQKIDGGGGFSVLWIGASLSRVLILWFLCRPLLAEQGLVKRPLAKAS